MRVTPLSLFASAVQAGVHVALKRDYLTRLVVWCAFFTGGRRGSFFAGE